MTFDPMPSSRVEVEEPVMPGASDGWAQVTFAINSILQLSTPVFLKIDADGHEPAYIDFRHSAFVWSTSLFDFPTHPRNVSFETEMASPDAPPLFRLPGQPLNSLLWLLGQHAYPGQAAPWMRPGERYRLAQWPNLARHLHDMRQMHMLAILGNGFFSADELAAMADVPVGEAHNLLNALSLLRLLRVSEEVAPIVLPPEAKDRAPGLFARLLARLGK